jgi:hypothetical protein
MRAVTRPAVVEVEKLGVLAKAAARRCGELRFASREAMLNL